MPSAIPNVIDALQTKLGQRTALAGVTITEGPATRAQMAAKELIQILDAVGDQTVRALNAQTQPRNEEFDLTILISVVGATRAKQTALRARAFVLMGEIESQLQTDPHLGLVGVYAAVVGHEKYTPRATDTVRESAIEFDINVQARL